MSVMGLFKGQQIHYCNQERDLASLAVHVSRRTPIEPTLIDSPPETEHECARPKNRRRIGKDQEGFD